MDDRRDREEPGPPAPGNDREVPAPPEPPTDPGVVAERLEKRAEDVLRALLLEYGDRPIRDRTVPAPGEFPATTEDLFPWTAVALARDAGGRVLYLEDSDREAPVPPAARGRPEESAADTAVRAVRTALADTPGDDGSARDRDGDDRGGDGDHPPTTVEDLALLERVAFDYGDRTVPVVQAVFSVRVAADRPATADGVAGRWLAASEVPDGARYRGSLDGS
jgi:hypothetical protein